MKERRGFLGVRWVAWFWWLVLTSYSAFLFFLSSRSDLRTSELSIPHFDKVLHAGAYALWALLFLVATRLSLPRLGGFWLGAAAVVAATAYGASDELHQAFVPGRESDVLDLAMDCAGALAIVILWWCLDLGKRLSAPPSTPPGTTPGHPGKVERGDEQGTGSKTALE